MTAGEAFQSVFKNLTNASGRASRSEFWWVHLALLIIDLIFWSAIHLTELTWLWTPFLVLSIIGFFLMISLSIRRLHDRNLSAGWYILVFVPIANLGLIILFALPGTKGPNRFGPDPLALKNENALAGGAIKNQSNIQQHMAAAGPSKISVSEKPESIANPTNSYGAMLTSEPPPNLQIDEDELYQQAFGELENDEKVVATWARSFAEVGGDEQKAKALYIQHRVDVLKTEIIETYKQELAEAEKEKTIAEEQAAAAKIESDKQRVMEQTSFEQYVANKKAMSKSLLRFFGLIAVVGIIFVLISNLHQTNSPDPDPENSDWRICIMALNHQRDSWDPEQWDYVRKAQARGFSVAGCARLLGH